MKSKAQEYAEFFNKEVPCPPRFRKAHVTQDGTLYIDPMNLESNEALDFAYWIISTFDTPKIPGRQPGWSRED
jgi:hypothetical protein